MAKHTIHLGDLIQYRAADGDVRNVRVTSHAKVQGKQAFEAIVVDSTTKGIDTGEDCWGFTTDILAVIERASAKRGMVKR